MQNPGEEKTTETYSSIDKRINDSSPTLQNGLQQNDLEWAHTKSKRKSTGKGWQRVGGIQI